MEAQVRESPLTSVYAKERTLGEGGGGDMPGLPFRAKQVGDGSDFFSWRTDMGQAVINAVNSNKLSSKTLKLARQLVTTSMYI